MRLEKNESQWGTEEFLTAKRSFVQPLWTGGDNIRGKTILLHAEQGFGDTIQFCRYASLVAESGARVILEVPRVLHHLMDTLNGCRASRAQG